MKKLNLKLKNNKNGITLIALIITIIVLLILAGVTIATLTGDNGILTRANEAKTKTENAKETELRRLTALEATANTENTTHTDTSTGEEKTITIPAGFAVSQIEGENTIADGLVIIDKNGNEFVWIPVDNFYNFVRYDFGNQNIQKDYFINTSPEEEKYYEPNSENANGTTDSIKEEVIKMYDSVKSNKGFYIARYEAGNDEGIFNEETKEWSNNGKVVSKKGVQVYNYIKWSSNIDIETNGAVEKAREMYPGHSTLVYGVQWDSVMNWIDKDEINNSILKDSNGKGNYLDINNFDNPAKTGSQEKYKIKNIYDMAGNIWEWTMESYNTKQKVLRGGSYKNNFSISYRSFAYYNYPSEDIGFRVAYYI